jgi:CTP:molybdopterin cytidylyltransferase MocA
VNADGGAGRRPRVSVCIVNHNYAAYLADAIESVLDQDYDELEVVVVDDGSTDDSVDVANRYADRAGVVAKRNGGQASAMNAGFRATTGDVVLFLDADDMLTPGTVALVASAFRDPSLAKVQFAVDVVGPDGTPLGIRIPGPHAIPVNGDLRDHVLRTRNYPWPPNSGNAFSSAALAAVLPVPEDAYRVDADCYLAETVPLCGRVATLARVGALYRWHPTNNSAARESALEWLHRKMQLTAIGHAEVRRIAQRLGLPLDGCPADAHDVPDIADLGVRLASVRLDPDTHPIVGDTPRALAVRGIRASLRHPYLPVVGRVKRAGWFALAGLTPGPVARRVVAVRIPDGPYRPRRDRLVARTVDAEGQAAAAPNAGSAVVPR